MHVHSRVSPDALTPPEVVVDAARRAGLDGVAITDHDRGGAYEQLVRAGLADRSGRAVDGFLVIPGVEVSALEGHVLVLGAAFDARAGLSAKAVVREAHRRGALAVAPHPFDRCRSGVGAGVLDSLPFDAIEGCNAKSNEGRSNATATRYAARRGLPMVAGSDAHFASVIGRAHTIVTCEELSVPAVLSAVRAGATELVRGVHTPAELARYLAGGWLTRPWLFDLVKRTAAARRRRHEFHPALAHATA